MSKFKIIVVSKDKTIKLKDNELVANYTIHNHGHQLDASYVTDNKLPLTTVYNKYLIEERKFIKYDFMIFMHADVTFDIASLLDHIEQCKDKYEVMGLCGTSIMNVSSSPLHWWTRSNPTPLAKWGCVTHGELGNQQSFFSCHSPDVTDHEVSCIDGLCIIFGRKAIESDILFDQQFTYDFYDTDISFQAIMNYRFKIGVLVEKSLQHYSVGRSILSEEFLRHEVDFRKKWKLEIPPNSPINRLK